MSTTTNRQPLGGVLVGGRSRRFGSDKAAARLDGVPLVERAERALRQVSEPVVLLGGDGSQARGLGLSWCPDRHRGAGPLAGVAAGLRLAAELHRNGLLVLACDLPLVTPALLREIFAAADRDVEAVVPRMRAEDDVQPLCAWYAAGALEAAERLLATSARSMKALLAELSVRYVSPRGASADAGSLLLNVNTPEDLARAGRCLEQRRRAGRAPARDAGAEVAG